METSQPAANNELEKRISKLATLRIMLAQKNREEVVSTKTIENLSICSFQEPVSHVCRRISVRTLLDI